MSQGVTEEGVARPSRRRLALGVIVPTLAVGIAASVVLWWWRGELPSSIATHFGPGGAADGYSSIGVVIAIPILVAVLLAAVGAFVCSLGGTRFVVQAVTGVTVGVTVLIAILVPAMVECQRGLVDGTEARFPQWWAAIAVVVAVMVGVLVAQTVPRWTDGRRSAAGERPMADIADAERFVWTRRVSSRPLNVVLAVSVLLIVGIGVVLGLWPLLVLAAVLVIPMILLWSIRVTVSRVGVTIRGALGWPRISVAADDIEYAEVVDVSPLVDYGGYGYRLGIVGALAGTKGFVLASGPAILVHRREGRGEVVVVDDAATAVGLINAVAHRAG